MQEGEPGTVALTAFVGSLQVTVQGPLSEATALLQHLQLWDPSQASSSSSSRQGASPLPVDQRPSASLVPQATSPPAPSASSSRGFSAAVPVTQDHLPAPVATAPATRQEAELRFPPCPAAWLDRAVNLGESNLSPVRRIERAWRAGQWARLVLLGNYASPLPSENLRLASRYYPVLGGGGAQPCLYTSFRACQAVLGPISGSSAVFHGFPSELEAKVYVDAAGLAWPLGGP